MNHKVLGISGKKESGKTSAANYLIALVLASLRDEEGKEVVTDVHLSSEGKIMVPAEVDGAIQYGEFDIKNRDPQFVEWARQMLFPHINVFSYATALREICVDLFGMDWDLINGNNEEKETPLGELKWKDVGLKIPKGTSTVAPITYRDVLKLIGNYLRKFDPDVWVKKNMRAIANSNTGLCLIDDVRFPNEVEAIQKMGGKVIRLTRNIHEDESESEVALDGYDGFDYILDNSENSMEDNHVAIVDKLKEWGYLNIVEVEA